MGLIKCAPGIYTSGNKNLGSHKNPWGAQKFNQENNSWKQSRYTVKTREFFQINQGTSLP